jgi:hypothetical protein
MKEAQNKMLPVHLKAKCAKGLEELCKFFISYNPCAQTNISFFQLQAKLSTNETMKLYKILDDTHPCFIQDTELFAVVNSDLRVKYASM